MRSFFLVVAALLLAACHDEPVDVTPVGTAVEDTVVQELPNSEWWECTLTNLGPLEDGDNLLLNISWDSGMYYAHTTSMHGSPTLFYNEITNFHMSDDTMHCDNPVYSGLIWWIISYPDDSTMKMRTMFYAGHEVYNQVWLYQFRRLN